MRELELHDAKFQKLVLECDGTGTIAFRYISVLINDDNEFETGTWAAKAFFRFSGLVKWEARFHSLLSERVSDGQFLIPTGDPVICLSHTDLVAGRCEGIEVTLPNEQNLVLISKSFLLESLTIERRTGPLP